MTKSGEQEEAKGVRDVHSSTLANQNTGLKAVQSEDEELIRELNTLKVHLYKCFFGDLHFRIGIFCKVLLSTTNLHWTTSSFQAAPR